MKLRREQVTIVYGERAKPVPLFVGVDSVTAVYVRRLPWWRP